MLYLIISLSDPWFITLSVFSCQVIIKSKLQTRCFVLDILLAIVVKMLIM